MADIGAIAATPTQSATITESLQEQDLGRDAFLKLLTVQLKNQDPMDPVKNEDFVAQLSQFSSLEQLQQINKAVSGDGESSEIGGVQQAVESNTAVSLIGRKVDIPSETITYLGEGDVQVGYYLAGPANRVEVNIFDDEGNLVRTLTDTSPDEGNGSVSWDGANDTGQSLSAGTYHVVLQATNGEGNAVTVQAQTTGVVTGVRYQDGQPILILDGAEAPLSGIGRVSQTE